MNFRKSEDRMVGIPEGGDWHMLQKAVRISRAFYAGNTLTNEWSESLDYMNTLNRALEDETEPECISWPTERYANFTFVLRTAAHFMLASEAERAELLATQIEVGIDAHQGRTA